jgi:hypothetical protein
LAQRQADGRRTASLHEFEPEGEDDDQDRQSGEVQNKDHRARSADYRIDALRRAHQEALHAVEIPSRSMARWRHGVPAERPRRYHIR